jgi:hypothetical protein
MNEEQLLQEARLEAEKVYPSKETGMGYFDNDINDAKQEGYISCYIANAKKRESEAVEFFEWMKISNYIKYESGYRHFSDGMHGKLFTINELFDLFLQQQQKQE